jgi:hypothetical protein
MVYARSCALLTAGTINAAKATPNFEESIYYPTEIFYNQFSKTNN